MLRIQTVLFALAAALSVLAAGLVWYVTEELPAEQISRVAAAQIGGAFALIDQNGRPRSDGDFRGRFALVYFGYTYCPDVCPTTLQHIADAWPKLGAKAARVVPVFITVDPERDTPGVLRKYLAAFGPQFVGLTGSARAIAQAARAYRVYFAREPEQGGTYAVAHSGALYLMDPKGKFVTAYETDIGTDALAKDLKARL